MILYLLLLVLGFVLLIKGADWLVDGSTALAHKHHISDLVIGLTIVSFGTSAPELVVNGIAAATNHPDIVFGNIIGSNNVNLFLVLGLSGLILPIAVQSNTIWKEIPISLLAAGVVLFISNNFLWQEANVLNRYEALFMLLLFSLFLYYVFKQMKNDAQLDVQLQEVKQGVAKKEIYGNLKIWTLIIIGLAGLVLGGNLVVNNATKIATQVGISEKVIGLTIVAIGTSLPELVTSIVAAIRKNSDIVIGNVIGSNIFNFLLILPVSALVNPVTYNQNFNTDLYVLIGGSLMLFAAMFTGKTKSFDRLEAAILLLVYITYNFMMLRNI